MERLTFEGNFCDIAQCKEIPCPYNGECSQREVWERLKAYEDTGLTPERCAEFARADAEGRYIVMRDAEQEGVARLRELAEADKDGRVVVLPCKVGQRVFALLDTDKHISECEVSLRDMHDYLHAQKGYGWHISNLKIYDTPKKLSEFKGLCKVESDCCACPYYNYSKMDCDGRTIKRPPQSWCYVEATKDV